MIPAGTVRNGALFFRLHPSGFRLALAAPAKTFVEPRHLAF